MSRFFCGIFGPKKKMSTMMDIPSMQNDNKLFVKQRGFNSGIFYQNYHPRSTEGTEVLLEGKTLNVKGGIRTKVSDEDVSWEKKVEMYYPMFYEDICHGSYDKNGAYISNPAVWSDLTINNITGFNTDSDHEKTGKPINRKSYEGPYKFNEEGYPLNPRGRTGIAGRGLLGRWGPNHAADPIMMRKKDGNIQFVGVLRADTEEWALPGGMVEPGDNVSVTLIKEFAEEAASGISDDQMGKSENQDIIKEKIKEMKRIFKDLNQKTIYKGVVDDPRNTDNAWMETVAVLFVVTPSSPLYDYKLKAGDDAKGVNWITYTNDLKLYASHADFVRNATIEFNKMI